MKPAKKTGRKVAVKPRASAIVRRGDAILFLRKEGEIEFYLPFVETPRRGRKGKLLRYLEEALGLHVKVNHEIPEYFIFSAWQSYTYFPFLCDGEVTKLPDGYEFVFLEEKDPRFRNDVEPDSAKLAKRAFIYAPYYQKTTRTVPLLEEDQGKVVWELKCIEYFSSSIPVNEIKEFRGLIASTASLRRINDAFVTLCNRFQCDPTDFQRYINQRKKA